MHWCQGSKTCSPGLSILALPIGIKKSGLIASSDISNWAPYMTSFSRTTTVKDTWKAAISKWPQLFTADKPLDLKVFNKRCHPGIVTGHCTIFPT